MTTSMDSGAHGRPPFLDSAFASIVTVRAARGPAVSGTVVGPELVLATAHVLRGGAAQVTAGGEAAREASLAGHDPLTDLALLRVPGLTAPALSAGRAAQLGEPVFAVARPASGPMVTAGILSGEVTGRGGQRWLLTDARPFQGFSGGALVGESGALLGVLNAGVSRGELLAVPAAVALDISGQLAVGGAVARGFLGVQTQGVRLPDGEHALLVTGMEADSPAADAGVLVGDLLREWNGDAIRRGEDLLALVLAGARQQVSLGLLRGGQPVTLSVTVGARGA